MRSKYKPIVYFLFLLLTIYVFAPYIWLITASISKSANLSTEIPSQPTLQHYARMFKGETLLWIGNSLLISTATTLLSVLVASLGSYTLSRVEFKGKSSLMYGILIARVLPLTMLVVPLYTLALVFNLVDSYIGLVLIYIGITIPLNLWILKGNIGSIPLELEEAAEISGATKLKVLFRVVLPLIKPGLAAAGVMSFMVAWRGFLLPLILINSSSKYPLSVGLFTSFGQRGVIDYPLLAAFCVVYMVPVIIGYLILRPYFSKGIGSLAD